jgi:tetratricopeptide (TPR) repeat protein
MDDLAGMEARMKPARRRWLLVVLAVSFCLPWSPAADARGLLAWPRGQWRLSRARWRRAAADDKIKQLLAAAKEDIENDEPEAAETLYSTVLRMEPGNVKALIGRGGAMGRLDKFDAAMDDFQAAVRLSPRNADALCRRGAVYAKKGDFPRAFADCEEAIRLDPKNGDAYGFRGYARSEHHEFDKAIADYSRAVELGPHDAYAWLGLGAVLANNRHLDDANVALSEAIRLNPRIADCFRARAMVWGAKKEYGNLIADITEAIRLKPATSQYYLLRAEAYEGINDLDRAISDCEAAIRLDQQNAEAFRNRGWCFGKKNDCDAAFCDLNESIRLDPKDAWSRGERASLYRDRGDFEKALADADAAVSLDPDNPEWYFLRGSIYEKKHDESRAKEDYDRCGKLRLGALLRELDLPPASKQPKVAVAALEKRIKEQVKSLDYGNDVAQAVVTLVRDWNLVALAQQLDTARERQTHGKLSTDQLAGVEQKVAEHIARMINAVILYDNEKQSTHELTGVAGDKRGCCQGMAMLHVVLGRALGLHVDGLFVEVAADGPSPDGSSHAACIVTLSDGDVIMADPTGGGLGYQSLVSKAFRFDAVFRPLGNCWELKDKSNPLGLYQVVQREDTSGLIAMLYDIQAEDQRNKGNAAEAARLCDVAIARSPKLAYSYLCRGLLLADARQFDKAVSDFSTALSHDPAVAVAYAARGACYEQLRKLDQARDDYMAALKLNPKLSGVPALLGEVYCTRREYDKAIVAKAIEESPKESRYFAARAFAWSKKAEDDANAAAYYSRLVSAHPNNNVSAADSGNNVATSWSGLAGQWSGGRSASLPDASTLSTSSSSASVNQFSLSGQPRNPLFDSPSTGVGSLRQSGTGALDFADLKPANEEEGRRRKRENEEETAKAVADYSEAIRLDPKFVDAYQYRAYLYATCKRFDLAVADFAEAIRVDGKNIALRKGRCAVYVLAGDLDKAIADLTEVIRRDPKTAENYTVRAELYAKKHDTNKAAADIAEAERLAPSDNRYR